MKRLNTFLVLFTTSFLLTASSSVPISGEPKTNNPIAESRALDAVNLAATNQDASLILSPAGRLTGRAKI